MPTPRWRDLNHRIVRDKLQWDVVKGELLNILAELDQLRRDDRIREGQYRQKGNYFKDTIIALVKARCGFVLQEREIIGKTDKHRVDICYLGDGLYPVRGFVLLAGEVKAMGSPAHQRDNRHYQERTLTIDIDKRIKEVKYTSVDLKRLNDPDVSNGWGAFIARARPAFFTAWLMRLAARDRKEHIFTKLIGITEYTNGIGVALYQERKEGHYEWIEKVPKPLLTIGQLVDVICDYLHKVGRGA